MGKNNSSEIRVKPFGEKIISLHNAGGAEPVEKLLHLIGIRRIKLGGYAESDLYFLGHRADSRFDGEISLKPSEEHLRGIIDLLYENEDYRTFFRNAVEKSTVSASVKEQRIKLANRAFERETVYEAVRKREPWAILEGDSKPDLFIETGNALVIVEGKLTEPHTTTSTMYLPVRNQMVRHIQGAAQYLKEKGLKKRIIAFYIVPEGFSEIREIRSRQEFMEILNAETVPLERGEKEFLQSCYYGCTTWEKVAAGFQIQFRAVIV